MNQVVPCGKTPGGEYVELAVDAAGNLGVADTTKDLNAVTAVPITTAWTPASGKTIRLMGGVVSVNAVSNVLFEDNAAGAGNFVFRTPKLEADKPFAFTIPGGKRLSAADRVLKMTASAAANVTGTLYGREEDGHG